MDVELLGLWANIQVVSRPAAFAFGGMLLIAPTLILQSGGKNWVSAFETTKRDIISESITWDFVTITVHDEEIRNLHFRSEA